MCRQQPFAALDASPSSPLSPSVRRLLLDHLQIALQQSDTLYALVLAADGTCVAQCRARGTEPLAPRDLLLLSNFVWATESFRAGEEGITPVCLPHANADAFFHAYIRYGRMRVVLAAQHALRYLVQLCTYHSSQLHTTQQPIACNTEAAHPTPPPTAS